MITEDYVSFEVAKLLKEKGFKGQGEHFYEDSKITNFANYWHRITPEQRYKAIEAPTIQMVMKWLRIEKSIAIVPTIHSILDNEKFLWDVEIVVAKTGDTYHQGWIYEKLENAVNAALKYCLTNLIK